jgi:dTDP-4-dehydrorhamnose 3,5-epimerase
VRVVSTELPGVLLIEPDVHRDARGFFIETYHTEKYSRIGIADAFVQDNHSRSLRGTLRGLHMQRTRLQGKLVRVVEGEIYDIAVDLRRGSPTFGRWAAATLSADNYLQLWIPPGFAHGFCVVSPVAQVEYKCTAVYDPADEIAIAWNDATLNITWPIAEPILSVRDSRNPPLTGVMDRLPSYG